MVFLGCPKAMFIHLYLYYTLFITVIFVVCFKIVPIFFKRKLWSLLRSTSYIDFISEKTT